MIYRDFQDMKLSALGFGSMRLPVADGNDAQIDEAAALAMVDYALAHGVNYFDTAWGYHGGTSELVTGRALARHPRESFNIASKFPGYDLSNMGKVEEIFAKQLEKCQVEHFDFYLVHNVCESNIDAYLDDERYGTVSYLKKMRDEGRIRHLGFSCHGQMDVLERFLEAYGADMEFCQLQLNYLDWTFQDAKGKMELAGRYDLPIWVMEPLRGGQLARLTDEQFAPLKAMRPDETQVGWALRFLQSLPEVTTVLSGSSSLEQMAENIALFEEEHPLSAEETEALLGVADDMVRSNVLPCTACRYCTSHCPVGLDIPMLLALFNEHKFTNGGFIAPMMLGTLPEDERPAACIGCGTCSSVCPQQIDIPAALADFAAMLEK